MWKVVFLKDKRKVLLIGFMAYFTFWGYSWYSEKNEFSYIIRSDGSGYYAYLPSLFIYDDPTYEKAQQAEATYHQGNVSKNYIFKTRDGAHYNKYFPGLAVLQVPFFLLACLFSKILGSPVDGYTTVFQVFSGLAVCFMSMPGSLCGGVC